MLDENGTLQPDARRHAWRHVHGGEWRDPGTGEQLHDREWRVVLRRRAYSLLANNTTTTISGTINNAGTILLNSTGNFTDLSLAGNTTLTGSGLLRLVNADRVRGTAS